jgi:multiple antibiotic resistance protein
MESNRFKFERTITSLASLLLMMSLAGLASASAATPGVPVSTPGATTQLSYAMVFTCFMVMLGPIKMVGPFVKMTAGLEESAARRVGLKALGIACLAGLFAAVSGQNTLMSWGIAPSSLHLAAGIILLLTAVKNVMAQYGGPAGSANPATPTGNIVFSPLAFPTIITPHGLAAFILLLAVSHDVIRDLAIMGLFFAVMALNLVVLWYARPIIRRGAFLLQIIGAVLGVLQVALAIQMMVEALRFLKVLAPL